MYQILLTDNFVKWLDSLKDPTTRRRLARRLEKAEQGNLGDVKPIGENVSEMREYFGPGWRMYYVPRGDTLIVMLGGGDKSSQKKDIKLSIELAKQLEDRL
ncbi:type II toxin-antitoxin system RelE/ParE family toxin [Marinospirillum insulare]|uniref:Addiction module killer protein n=1 Tax=Marinospirillum insulare TaxID=217169 RepID=A0ABQ5ZTD5_9GAMM|nr:type II toxin-antitoxin system RelE/ParE family toxin [Marinospirillum insulare]GLR63400.1 hypothetical protein GCM10007878_08350 [Marinospirillum insulare]